GGREPASEEAVGGAAARQCSPEGSGRKKLLTPRARHAGVRNVIALPGLSERRATRLLGVDRSGLRYRPRRPDDAADRNGLAIQKPKSLVATQAKPRLCLATVEQQL